MEPLIIEECVAVPCCNRLTPVQQIQLFVERGHKFRCYCEKKLTFSIEGREIKVTAIEQGYLEVMNFYRFATASGEIVLYIPGKVYERTGDEYDHRKHHYFQRFYSEVNTSLSNILGFEIEHYDRKTDQFTGRDDDLLWYVGHVTMDEWNKLLEDRSENPTEMALSNIEMRTGVKRREQFRTGEHGPCYWDDDSEEDEEWDKVPSLFEKIITDAASMPKAILPAPFYLSTGPYKLSS